MGPSNNRVWVKATTSSSSPIGSETKFAFTDYEMAEKMVKVLSSTCDIVHENPPIDWCKKRILFLEEDIRNSEEEICACTRIIEKQI
jgi:hypothetical protein